MPRNLDEAEILKLSNLTIQEKIDKNDWYQFGNEIELQEIVKKSRQSISKINRISEYDEEQAEVLLGNFLPYLAETSKIMFPISGIEYPEKLVIGENSFINSNLQIISAGRVDIGKNTFIGPNVQIFTANHHTSNIDFRSAGWQYDLPVTVGNDCWLGGAVILLPGVSLGNDVIVGAGSVVTKNFPSHSIIAGNPAKIIKNMKNKEGIS